MARLTEPGVFAVDRLGDGATELPKVLRGRHEVLVNLTWSGVVETSVTEMWPGLVVLPAIGAQGVTVHHLMGVKGFAFPPFPGDCSGGLPCCAASASGAMEIVVVKMQPGVS